MAVPTKTDFSLIDRPEILQVLFHPRPAWGERPAAGASISRQIPVAEDVAIGACFHMADKTSPNIVFFHGNGEIVSDYDDLGPIYNQKGLNFLVVDYRGYGTSTGQPTVATMMADCHVIFGYIKNWLGDNGYTGPLVVMGRSLGSASALELAATHMDEMAGVIIESGFAYAGPLLALLGVPARITADEDAIGLRNIWKIKQFTKPTLIIHAEYDHIIPFSDGQILYEESGAEDKRLLKIPDANHNDIFARALSEYMQAIVDLTDQTH